jgi:hypothetical protein
MRSEVSKVPAYLDEGLETGYLKEAKEGHGGHSAS